MEKILFIIGLCLILCPNVSLAKSKKTQSKVTFTLPSAEKIKAMSNKERQVFFRNLQQVMTRFEKDFGYAISSEFKGESAFAALQNIFIETADARLPTADEEAEEARRRRSETRRQMGDGVAMEESQRVRPRTPIQMGDGRAMEESQAGPRTPIQMGDGRAMEEAAHSGGAVISPAADEAVTRPDPNTSDLRCVYAGFVVKGKKCTPPKSTTIKYTINGAEKDVELKCPNGKLLCNPFVFGVKEKTRRVESRWVVEDIIPVCVSVPRDKRNTSRECYYASTDATATSGKVIELNAATWNTFNSELTTLCDPEFNQKLPVFKNRSRALKDLNDTCAWAKTAIERRDLENREAAKTRFNPNQDNRAEDTTPNEGIE